MTTIELLDALSHEAHRNPDLRAALLKSRRAKNPLQAFCQTANTFGFELYPMEVLCAGEEFHAAMKRSTNGGGENSPKLDGQDDFYELFMAELEDSCDR